MTDINEERQLVDSELHVVASDELEEQTSADLLLPEGDIQLNSMFGEAMYFTPPVYTFDVDGDKTEEITMQAPGKIWKNPTMVEYLCDEQGIPRKVLPNE